jgi:hypothetical protein
MPEESPQPRNASTTAPHIFSNAPHMIALCLTAIGLVKIYARLQGISTLADDLLALDAAGFLAAHLLAYLALRRGEARKAQLIGKIADTVFVAALALTVLIAVFVTYGLEG